jgi:23S rRNA pseudouridine1911/1915/1917 synthase
VPPEWAGLRLDRALVDLVPELGRKEIQERIRAGEAQVDGLPVTKPSLALAPGAEVIFAWEDTAPIERAPLALEVLLETPDYCVVDKPAGVLCHPNRQSTQRDAAVSDWLLERCPQAPVLQGEDRPGIVHRLDAQTSGCLVVAKTEAAAESLVRQFRERTVEKTYVGLTRGEPRFDSDWIELGIARNERSPERRRAIFEHELDDLPEELRVREAQTFYRVLERFGKFALVELTPKTGRTHQLRVHLEAIGAPLVGDRLYKGSGREPRWPKSAPSFARQALHARSLAFDDPGGRGRVIAEAPLPADFRAALDYLRRG